MHTVGGQSIFGAPSTHATPTLTRSKLLGLGTPHTPVEGLLANVVNSWALETCRDHHTRDLPLPQGCGKPPGQEGGCRGGPFTMGVREATGIRGLS